MGNLTTAVVFVIAINVLMFLTQSAIFAINPDTPQSFFSNKGTLLANFDTNNNRGIDLNANYSLDTDGNAERLPTAEGFVSPSSSGDLFTDAFSSIKSWFAKSTGLSYLGSVLSAPYNILKSMGLPNPFVFAMGTLWYVITFLVLIAFLWGRDA
jgi:hypothetical protein